MNMTREEAIMRINAHIAHHRIGEYPHIKLAEALEMAISALRPVRREQVDQVRAHWITVIDADYIELPPRRDTPERLAKRRRQWLAATLRGLVWPLACAAIGGAAVLIVL